MRLLYLDLSPLLLLLDLVGAGGLDLQPPLHSLPDWISRSLCEERIPDSSHHDILVLSSILQLQGGAPNQVDDYTSRGGVTVLTVSSPENGIREIKTTGDT